jgi:hypothetical protein
MNLAEARYEVGLAMAESYAAQLGGTANKARVREEAAHELPADKDMRKRLEAIAEGKRKLIDENWWRKVHGDVNRAKLDKIARHTDPARNNNENERDNATRMLAAAKARRPPGTRPDPIPLPTDPTEWMRKRKTKAKTKTPPFQQSSRQLSDSVAARDMSDSVAARDMSDSVAPADTSDTLKVLNERRAAARAAKRAGLRCQFCGKPLAARRSTARYCNAACRWQAWRASSGELK